jgi:hypothetical protein
VHTPDKGDPDENEVYYAYGAGYNDWCSKQLEMTIDFGSGWAILISALQNTRTVKKLAVEKTDYLKSILLLF